MTNPETLRLIAQAAADVPMPAVGALAHFAQSASPRTVLALLDRIEKLEAGLVEACDIAAAQNSFHPDEADRIAALRALAVPVTPTK